jgi:hypothetical protein
MQQSNALWLILVAILIGLSAGVEIHVDAQSDVDLLPVDDQNEQHFATSSLETNNESNIFELTRQQIVQMPDEILITGQLKMSPAQYVPMPPTPGPNTAKMTSFLVCGVFDEADLSTFTSEFYVAFGGPTGIFAGAEVSTVQNIMLDTYNEAGGCSEGLILDTLVMATQEYFPPDGSRRHLAKSYSLVNRYSVKGKCRLCPSRTKLFTDAIRRSLQVAIDGFNSAALLNLRAAGFDQITSVEVSNGAPVGETLAPTFQPTTQPTPQPTPQPTTQPTTQPTAQPTSGSARVPAFAESCFHPFLFMATMLFLSNL